MNGEYLTNELRESIIKQIVFFDLFSYPLTNWEIWQNLSIRIELPLLERALSEFIQKDDILEMIDGFYFLTGRSEIVTIRQKRYNYTNNKIKIAKKVSHIFRLLPCVKLVAVSNLIGHHNLRDESDIDIFIISSPRRVWLTRLFCTGLMKLANMRPTEKAKKNKICLSFYASVEGLNMEKLRFNLGDPYFDHWFLGLYPVYNKDNIVSYLRFKNPWLREAFPNSLLLKENFADDYFKRSWGEWIFFGWGDFLNWVSKKFQMSIMPKQMKNLSTLNRGVLISDAVLRFYLHDRREDFYKSYQDSLAKFNIYE